MSTSPGRRKSRTVCSASRPCVVVPLRFSARIVSQPAARNTASRIDSLIGRAGKSETGEALMDFVESVLDLGATEINVTSVASIERISDGQVRVTYFIRRKGENTVAVHLIWDREEWLRFLRLLDQARESIEIECGEFARVEGDEIRRVGASDR
jgi:hypothetical protein